MQMRSYVGVQMRLSRSLVRSFARRFRLPIRGFIIERADFQGLPRASAIPSRARNGRTRTSLLPGRVKHLDRVKPPSHTRERSYVERARRFLQQEQAKLSERLTLGAPENRIAPVLVVFLEIAPPK